METKKRKRINVIFPGALIDELKETIPPRERNRFIVEATQKELRRARLSKAVAGLREEPAWTDAHHPGLGSPEDVQAYSGRLRQPWPKSAENDDDPQGAGRSG